LDKRGNGGFWVLLGALLLLAGALLWWWSRPTPQPVVPSHPPNQVSAYPPDPPEASRKLVEALHARLDQGDYLKLLDEPVETDLAVLNGDKVRTYRETYRIPRRTTAEALSDSLAEAARLAGADRLEASWGESRLGRDYSVRFGFPGGWAPVTMVFREVKLPRVALVVDDAGYAGGHTMDKLWALKIPATVAIIPGLEFSTAIAQGAPSHGWEVICHMPMEGHEAVADGAYKWFLQRSTNPGEVTGTLVGALSGLPNCRGMNNHMGSLATTDLDLMLQVGHFLKSRGMFFLDSRTSDKTVAVKAMREAGVPVGERNVFLDNSSTPESIKRQLRQAVALAKKRGYVVAIGHVREKTLETLADAVPEARTQDVQFVYLSELVK